MNEITNLDELDNELARIDGCVDAALEQAKAWIKFTKELVAITEKKLQQDNEYAKTVTKIASNMSSYCGADVDKYLPMSQYFANFSDTIVQDMRQIEANVREATMVFVTPVNKRRTEHEKKRKAIYDKWKACYKAWADADAACTRAEALYNQRQQELERAQEDKLDAETEMAAAVSAAGPNVAKTEAKVEKKRRQLEDCVQRAAETESNYKYSVNEANEKTAQLGRVRLETVKTIRLLIQESDYALKQSTVVLLELMSKGRHVCFEKFQNLNKEIDHEYVPGNEYFKYTRVELIAKRGNLRDPDYTFKKYAPGGGPLADRSSDSYVDDSKDDARSTISNFLTSATSRIRSTSSSMKKKSPTHPSTFYYDSAVPDEPPSQAKLKTALSVVNRCIKEIDLRGLKLHGIYRVSCGKNKVEVLLGDMALAPTEQHEGDPHMFANVLKLQLRELSEPLMTRDLYPDFLVVGKNAMDQSTADHATALASVCERLPYLNKQICGALFHHLKRIANFVKDNNMGASNLSLVFAPTLLKPPTKHYADGNLEILDQRYSAKVVEVMIEYSEKVFGPVSIYDLEAVHMESDNDVIDLAHVADRGNDVKTKTNTYSSARAPRTDISWRRSSPVMMQSTSSRSLLLSSQMYAPDDQYHSGAAGSPDLNYIDVEVPSGSATDDSNQAILNQPSSSNVTIVHRQPSKMAIQKRAYLQGNRPRPASELPRFGVSTASLKVASTAEGRVSPQPTISTSSIKRF